MQWGPWGGVGMAASDPLILPRLERAGYGVVSAAEGLGLMQVLLAGTTGPAVQMGSSFAWPRYLTGMYLL